MSVTELDAWPIIWPCEVSTPLSANEALAQQIAEDWLRSASGGSYGTGTVTEYVRPRLSMGCGYRLPYGGRVVNAGGSGGSCCAFALHRQPVRSITSVTVSGQVLSPSSYIVWRGKLQRVDGGCWPSADECDPPPITVVYRFGWDVPPSGQVALGELACEVVKMLAGDKCRIPKNARTISRQGVTIDKGEAATAAMVEAFPLSRQFLDTVNPKRLPGRSRVLDPLNGPAVRRPYGW